MDNKDNLAIRKRAQISKNNRLMLGTVVIASIIIGVAIVATIFLIQRISFYQKVITAQLSTENILKKSNDAIPVLEDNIRALRTNSALNESKALSSDDAVQVVLDALPSEANSLAVGGSLEKKLLTGIDNLALESLKVNPVIGIELILETGEVAPADSEGKISYIFSVKGSSEALQDLLLKLEKSIRVFDSDVVRIETQGNIQVLSIEGHTYYEPAVDIKISERTIQ